MLVGLPGRSGTEVLAIPNPINRSQLLRPRGLRSDGNASLRNSGWPMDHSLL